MKKHIMKMMLSLMVVGVLILSITAIAAAAGSQQWYLDGSNHATVTANKVMEKSGSQAGTTSIGAGGEVIWLSENTAQTGGVTFPSGSWVVSLETTANWGANCFAQVGSWNTSTGWHQIATTTGTHFAFANGILIVEVQTGSATIPGGEYLALKLGNSDGSAHTVKTQGQSHLVSPTTDPGFPVPEVAAGILFGIGLLGLVGYRMMKREKSGDEGIA